MSNFWDNYKGGYYVYFLIFFISCLKQLKLLIEWLQNILVWTNLFHLRSKKFQVNVCISWEENISQVNLKKTN